MDPYTEPHLDSSALITIDTQNDFTLAAGACPIQGTREVIPNMVTLLQAYRHHQRPIVHVVRLYPRDGSDAERCRRQEIAAGLSFVAPDSDGAELVTELKPEPEVRLDAGQLLKGELQPIGAGEFILYKPRWGAFYRTRLDSFLRERGVDTLVFCGCNYPNCPRSSIYQASERDYRVVLVSDALSQLYPRGETEMRNIGVALMHTHRLVAEMASSLNPLPEG
ncbi:MAG: cysteine hydrolase [Candidatus Thiodiazotropha sp.]